jgi:hypothetical protein
VRLGRLEAASCEVERPETVAAFRGSHDCSGSRLVSTAADAQRADRVAGFLCAFSLALSGIAVVRNPGLLATAAILVGLAAVVMTRAHRTLAAVTVAVAATAFLVGMVVAVLTDSTLY